MRWWTSILSVLLFLVPMATAESDECRGAVSTLNRVKEEITPSLAADTELGRSRLEVMHSALENATNVCPEFAELWYYRMVVSDRLGLARDAGWEKKKLDLLQYESRFNPFTLPAAALTPPEVARARNAKVRQKWALVIGIDKFQDSHIPALQYAVKDAGDFADFLKDPEGGRFDPSHIALLDNDDATLKGIRSALGNLRKQAQPDDMVVVYMASHGSPRERDPNGVSYVVTHDSDLENLYGSSLQMIDLVQAINREIRAQRVVLILDTCFSGDALTSLDAGEGGSGARGFAAILPGDPPSDAPASKAFSGAFQNLQIGYGRAVITASRADEVSWESAELKNGYFTHYLLEVLRAGGGNESLEHVFVRVRSTVSTKVKGDRGASQTPSFQLSEGADSIVLGVPVSN